MGRTVYAVVSYYDEGSGSYCINWTLEALFATEAHAASYVATRRAVSDDGVLYAVEAREVWEEPATTAVTTWGFSGPVWRKEDVGFRHPEQSVAIIPAGQESKLWHATLTPLAEEPMWATVAICAASEADACAAITRLVTDWREANSAMPPHEATLAGRGR